MKMKKFILLLAILLAAFALPATARAQGGGGDEFVFGDTYLLESGERLDGNLYVFGGTATLEEGSQVDGNVFLAGGNLSVDGEVDGDITAAGGLISLGETAVVTGDVNTRAASLNRDPGAEVQGEIGTNLRGPVPPFVGSGQVRVDNHNPILSALWYLFRSFLWAALAVLVVLFLPRHTQQVAATAVQQPLISGGLGLLTAALAPLVVIVLAITLILIPVALLVVLALTIAWAFGFITLGTEVGRRLGAILNQELALPVAAGLGTFILSLVVNGIGFIPCIGWLAPFLTGVVGLGAVLLTRAGTRPYPPAAPVAPGSPAAPVAPVAPIAPVYPETPVVYEEPPAYGDGPEGGAQAYPTEK